MRLKYEPSSEPLHISKRIQLTAAMLTPRQGARRGSVTYLLACFARPEQVGRCQIWLRCTRRVQDAGGVCVSKQVCVCVCVCRCECVCVSVSVCSPLAGCKTRGAWSRFNAFNLWWRCSPRTVRITGVPRSEETATPPLAGCKTRGAWSRWSRCCPRRPETAPRPPQASLLLFFITYKPRVE